MVKKEVKNLELFIPGIGAFNALDDGGSIVGAFGVAFFQSVGSRAEAEAPGYRRVKPVGVGRRRGGRLIKGGRLIRGGIVKRRGFNGRLNRKLSRTTQSPGGRFKCKKDPCKALE